jgi:hypothetical protein
VNCKTIAVLFLVLITITCTKSDKAFQSDGKISMFDETVQSDGKITGHEGIYSIDIINGIWENRKNGRLFLKKNFSWGENACSPDSVVIDLNADKPHISCQSFGPFYIQEEKSEENRIVLTGYYVRDRIERKDERLNKIIITLMDEDTITIDLIGRDRTYLLPGVRPENPNDYYYRIPVDALYDPLQPDEDI